jgi:uncharacterized integral membrane protein (TIGR00697 family)
MTFNRDHNPISHPLTRIGIIVVSAYIGAQLIADIASLKIGVVFGLAVDMGTFIYPVTFTLRDVVHKVLGKVNAQVVIIMAGVVNLVMAAYLSWVANVPGDPGWGRNEEFQAILGPVWRIVVASIIAELVSELIDTEIYQIYVNRYGQKNQWARVVLSNLVSIPIDSFIFSVGAFGGIVPWEIVWQIFTFNLIIKYVVSVLSIPLIYTVPESNH